MKRRILTIIALLGVALTICLVLCLCAQLDNHPLTITSTGPLDIRLWGIRPDDGDAIYDPNGVKIMETLGITKGYKTVWKENLFRRDFIFEISDTNEPVTFCALRYSSNGKEDQWSNLGKDSFYFDHNGRELRWFQTTFSRTRRKWFLFGLWKIDIPVDRVNLNLQYYYGPPHKPICTFNGPFEAGRKVTDKTGLYEISFEPPPITSHTELVMRFCPKQQIDAGANALFYDVQGKRHYVWSNWSFTEFASKEISYNLPSIPLKSIAMITIGEEPSGITVRNLELHSPTSEHRTYAEHLDKMAERLDPKRDATRYAQYRFKDISKLLKVIDVLRGEQISRTLRSPYFWKKGALQFDPATLNAEQLQILKQAVLHWANAMDPEIRVQAVKLGLHCKWRDFFDVAFDLLEYPDRNYFRRAHPARVTADVLYSQREQLSERDIDRIAAILPRLKNPGAIRRLQQCLEYPKSPARLTALWDLANCDQPWLWTDAIRQLSMWREFDRKCDSLPEKLKPRVFLIAGPNGFSDPDQIAPKVCDLQLTLLSSQLLTYHGSTCSILLRNIPESIDRRAMTDVMIESLRHMEYHRDWSSRWAISRIVKYLNLWYGMDISDLGSDVREQAPDLGKMDPEAVAAEAIKWYDTEYKGTDPNAAG